MPRCEGALFAIGDDSLLEYRHHFGRFHPYQVPQHLTARLQPVGEALTLVRDLHQRRNTRPVADTLNDLLIATRAHVAFALRPGGEQALANVLHVADLARRYEADGGLSFRGFVTALGEAADRAEAPEAPILEDGSDGVRLMTVHKAKGLEFPVVVLVDPTCKLSRDTADRHLDASRDLCAVRLAGWAPADLLDHEPLEVERDRHEGHRLAYVAATRARDLLVVPVVGDGPFTDGWVSPLNERHLPERRSAPRSRDRRRRGRRSSATACSSGPTATRRAPRRCSLACIGSARAPTSPTASSGGTPAILALDQRAPMGVRHENLIGKGASRAVVDETLEAFRQWESQRATAIADGSQPSLARVDGIGVGRGRSARCPTALRSRTSLVRASCAGRLDAGRPSGHALRRAGARGAGRRRAGRRSRRRRRRLPARMPGCWERRRRTRRAAADAARRALASPWVRRAAAARARAGASCR